MFVNEEGGEGVGCCYAEGENLSASPISWFVSTPVSPFSILEMKRLTRWLTQ